jgi:hypothetical protein
MAKVMLFKRGLTAKDLDMRYLDSEQIGHIEKFKNSGYLENPPLVDMYNPDTREQLTIHAEDRPILELRGFFASPTWVYHPQQGKKIVSAEEAKLLYNDGWYDTPAKFPGNQQGIAKVKSTLIMPRGAVA